MAHDANCVRCNAIIGMLSDQETMRKVSEMQSWISVTLMSITYIGAVSMPDTHHDVFSTVFYVCNIAAFMSALVTLVLSVGSSMPHIPLALVSARVRGTFIMLFLTGTTLSGSVVFCFLSVAAYVMTTHDSNPVRFVIFISFLVVCVTLIMARRAPLAMIPWCFCAAGRLRANVGWGRLQVQNQLFNSIFMRIVVAGAVGRDY